jgi:hypothetical protein
MSKKPVGGRTWRLVRAGIPLVLRVTRILLRKRRITASGCWEWSGIAKRGKGYGVISINRKAEGVHRVAAWLWLNLDRENPKVFVCHRCDNPLG